MPTSAPESFSDLPALALYLRSFLENNKYILLYAYNGTGKTRLSMAFKDLGKNGEERDTLYFNAYTQDLFVWNNDLENDTTKELQFNEHSRFLKGLKELEMESRIRPLLQRYADFGFDINYEAFKISFFREVVINGSRERVDNIKISRGEENIFIWCFFLAIVQLVIDKDTAYAWVKYIYIDDPISSLDDSHAISVATHLAQLLKTGEDIRVVISSHHALFYNVMYNSLKRAEKYFLSQPRGTTSYALKKTTDTPAFHHVAMLIELHQAEKSGELYTYHFNMLRTLLEKAASFHGFKHYSECLKIDDDENAVLFKRLIDLMSHGNYSLFEPRPMLEENKEHFKTILDNFMHRYPFNPELFSETGEDVSTS